MPVHLTHVRTTGHSHDDGVISETSLLADRLELVDQDGKVSLRLGHSETTVDREKRKLAAVRISKRQASCTTHQVGKATQADEDNLKPLWSILSSFHLASNRSISGLSSSVTSDKIQCWLAVNLKSPL